MPGEEDFGLVPLEAAAAGRPTIALSRAAARSKRSSKARPARSSTSRSPESLAAALRSFDATRFDPQSFARARRTVLAGAVHRAAARDRRARSTAQTLASECSSLRAAYIAAAVFAIVYIALDLNKLYALRYGADLGTYLQTLVNLQHGSSWNYGEWKHALRKCTIRGR